MPDAKILVVDDDVLLLKGIIDLLEVYGYEVVGATNGEEAIKQLEFAIPDLLLTDIMMPIMDGFQLYEAVLKNPAWRDIPVVFMGSPTRRPKGMEINACHFLMTPFDPKDIFVTIASLLAHRI